MRRVKLVVDEEVEVLCHHRRAGALVHDWAAGRVIRVDQRMAAVQFEGEVFSNNGWRIPDRVLWCAHGSPNLRRRVSEHPA